MTAPAITTVGNPVLRKKAKIVSPKDIPSPKIQKIIRSMSEALRATNDGIGIAAPQIGVSLRIFIASEEALHEPADASSRTAKLEGVAKKDQKSKKEWKHFVFINPEIVNISKKKTKKHEGCLSVPGTYGIVKRAEKVTVRACNETGKRFERGASGLFAQLFQHETDHLEGTLFIDRAEKLFKIRKEKK